MANKTAALAGVQNYSIIAYTQLEGMYDLAQTVKELDGAIVDVGCGNGGALGALWAGARKDKFPLKRQVWAFDSFAGIPQPDRALDGDKALQKWTAAQKTGGWCPSDPTKVHQVATKLKIKEDDLHVIIGDLGDTYLQAKEVDQIAILHIDLTLHQWTLLAIEEFYDRVIEGGLIIVSAYHHWQGTRAAVNQFLKKRGLSPLMLRIESAAAWRK